MCDACGVVLYSVYSDAEGVATDDMLKWHHLWRDSRTSPSRSRACGCELAQPGPRGPSMKHGIESCEALETHDLIAFQVWL